MIVWTCLCGFKTVDAQESFLHRDGSPEHHISPEQYVLEPVSGIEKEFATRSDVLTGGLLIANPLPKPYIVRAK